METELDSNKKLQAEVSYPNQLEFVEIFWHLF